VISVHVTQMFSVKADRETLERQADALMDALLEAEKKTGRVHSAAVSVDFGAETVEVEVTSDAQDRAEAYDAERACQEEVDKAIYAVSGTVPIVRERHSEMVPVLA